MKLKDLVASAAILFIGHTAHTSSGATHTLTINVSGSGTVTRNPTNSVYPSGATVILTALPAANWLFAGWSGDASGLLNPLNVLMNSNKIIHTAFVPIPNYTLTLTTNGSGAITLSPPGGIYPSNSTVQAQAIPEAGWVFLNWSGDADGSANPITMLMNTHRNIVANFAQLPQITVQPQSVTVALGGHASFNVTAVGTEPLSYQWSFNNAPINGANASSLVISNVQTTSAGIYSVVISNMLGHITSSTAFLEIANGCSGSNVLTECSETALRGAIVKGGWVRFCCNGTITLSNTITISNDVVLDATGFSVAISGNNAVRLFTVNSGVNFYLTNLWLINGLYRGTNGPDSGGRGEIAEGGAILNYGGTVCLIYCGLTNNQAVGGATTDFTQLASAEGRGGALANRNGTLLLQSVIAAGNSTAGGINRFFGLNAVRGGDAGGGVVFNEGGDVLIRDSVLRSNAALANRGGKAKGGAIYMASGFLDILDSTLASNVAEGGVGVLSAFGGPSFPGGEGLGGALYAGGGTAIVTHVTLLQNEAFGGGGVTGSAEAGGIYSTGTLVVSDSILSSNRAQATNTSGGPGGNARAGAVLSKGIATINRTTFSHNSAFGFAGGGARGVLSNGGSSVGGAVVNEGLLAVTNSTFAMNRVRSGDGAFDPLLTRSAQPGPAFGGAFFNQTGTVHLVNVTIASNLVIGGTPFTPALIGGAQIANSNGTVTLFNSILAYGTNGNGWGTLVDAGYNVSSDGSIPLNSGSSFSFTDPRLGPLKDNGGLTFTMGLMPDSPAIDFGGSAGAPSIDQRDFPRPTGSGIDIGAFEFPGFAPPLQIRRVGQTVQLSFEAEAGQSYDLQSSSNLVAWVILETVGPWSTNTLVKRTNSAPNDTRRFFRLEEH